MPRITRKRLWDATPRPVRQVLRPGIERVSPAWLLGRRFRKQRAFVDAAQYWSAAEAKTYQCEQLRRLCRLAQQHSEYYRQVFARCGFEPEALQSPEDIRKLPTIDKQIVIDNTLGMCTRSANEMDGDWVSTGGTGGIPLHFYIDADRSAMEYAYLTSSWSRAGYVLGMPVAVLRGRVVRADRDGFNHEYDPLLRHHYYSSFHMSDEAMERYLEHIAGIGACFLHVYPSTVATLTRFITRSGVEAPSNIKGVIAESEIVYPEQRRAVEQVFGCRLFSSYGQSEKVVFAAGCEHSTDYHIWPTYGYFELLDAEGNPVRTPGQRGEIVGTGFINTVMPFVRYRTGDWATYVAEGCTACGRAHTTIRDIRGHRIQEVLIASDGTEIPWVALNMHDDTFIHVRQFQFVQEMPGRALLRVVPADGFTVQDVGRIQRSISQKVDNQLTFLVEQVDVIPLSARGKAIYVDQRIPSCKGGKP